MFRATVTAASCALILSACTDDDIDPPRLKVHVAAKHADALEANGATLVADYGSFKVLNVDERALTPAQRAVIETKPEDDRVFLNAGTIDTNTPVAQSQRGVRFKAAGKAMHLVQFAGPIRPEWYAQLEATGVRVITYIPSNAYLVYGDASQLGRLAKRLTKSPSYQWDGEYLPDYRLDPSVNRLKTDTFAVQLVKDDEANAATLALIESLESRRVTTQEALGYVNVVSKLSRASLDRLVQQPDVVSIHARPEPRKLDERQNIVMIGNMTGAGAPTGPGYWAWLTSKGFTQAQFTASGFGVDITDSGLDNGTLLPNHFGLYLGGDVTGTSRVVYTRLEGTPNGGSTLSGCDGHGTLNTHIIGGWVPASSATPFVDAQGYAYGLGLAPFVKFGSSVIFDSSNYTNPDYEDLQARAYRDGMRISSNSWGSGSSAYTSDSQRYDALVRDAQPTGSAVPVAGNQQMSIIFAAGNAGSGVGTVGTPGAAKNVLTVGAAEGVQAFGGNDGCGEGDTGANSALDVIAFSSRGPTDDLRIKPDLMAPGTHISGGVAQAAGQRANPPAVATGQGLACFDGTGVCGGVGSTYFPPAQQWYSASSGTSHSTPAIAGASALLYQYFLNNNRPAPSPAMIKAFLMNTTRYMTGEGANDTLPSNTQGMGFVDLGRSFDSIGRRIEDQSEANLFTASGQTRTFTGAVESSTQPFRVTLAWSDAPGATSGNAYKNNLDLTVTVTAGPYKGNVFSGASSAPGGLADVRNNVESVFLPAGTTGAYTVTVTATNINSDGVPGNASALDQDFALVVYNSVVTPPVTNATATVNGNNRIDIGWSANGSPAYRVYRSLTTGGPYSQVGEVTTPPFADLTVSGGSTYFYVVRAVQSSAESVSSNEASATATGLCALAPTFAGISTAGSSSLSTCTNTLTWPAATPGCGGTLSYSVYRSTSSGFTPSPSNRLATGLTSTSFSDGINLSDATSYFYVVRATETSATVREETNVVEKSALVGGPLVPAAYLDDFDANRPPNAAAYFTSSAINGDVGTLNLTTGCHYQSSNKSYRFGSTGTACGGNYPSLQEVRLHIGGNGTAGVNGFIIDPAVTNAQMTFRLWYQFESTYDGAWLEYSTTSESGPYTTIADIAAGANPFISEGGYDAVVEGARAWTGNAVGGNGSLKAVTVNLNSLKGQRVWFAFRFFSDQSVVSEGLYIDNLAVTVSAPGACTTGFPAPGPATSFSVVLPALTPLRTAATVELSARDVFGQVAISYTGTATLTSSDSSAVLPANPTFVAGVATTSVTFNTMGAQTLTASASSLSGTGATTVTAGPPTKLVFQRQPSSSVAGSAISPSVQVAITDIDGNLTTSLAPVTLALAANPGSGALSGTLTVSAVSGVASFGDVQLDKAGAAYTLLATSPALTDTTSSAFDIAAGPAAKLGFTVAPTNSAAGASLGALQVVVQDAQGNAAVAGSPVVTLALGNNPVGATLSGTVSVAASAGVASFGDVSIAKAGTAFTLTATAPSLAAATSPAFDITAGAKAKLVILETISNMVSTTVLPLVHAEIQDALGNVVTTSSDSVSFGLSPAASLAGTVTVAAVAGVATASDLSIAKAGTYQLEATLPGLTSGQSNTFEVTVGPAVKLGFTAPVAHGQMGRVLQPVTVAVQDLGGNTIVGRSDTMTLSLNTGTLEGTLSRPASAGAATFGDLKIDALGTGYIITAAAAGLTSAVSNPFDVSSGIPTKLAVTVQPEPRIASGAAFEVRIEVQDAESHVVPMSAAEVTLAPSSGALAGTLRTSAVMGVASFRGLSMLKAGSYTLNASAAGVAGTATTSFDIVAGAPKTFKVVLPTTAAPSAPVTVTASASDENDNTVTEYEGSPTATSTDAAAVLPGAIAFAAGKASFVATFVTKGVQKLTLTDEALTGEASTTISTAEGPRAIITKPTEGQVLSGTALVTATATVPFGATVTSLALMLDGTVVATTKTAETSFDWVTTKATNGAHSLSAVVVDSTGASSTSTVVNVTVTNTAGCGCSSGGEASLLVGLLALGRLMARRRRTASAHHEPR